MQAPPADDRSVYIAVGPSGGRPDFAKMVELSSQVFRPDEHPDGGVRRAVRLAGDAVFYPSVARLALLDALVRWFMHRVVFRGGWTVYVDAPDRDPVKVRLADREQATARARELAARIDAVGTGAVDALT